MGFLSGAGAAARIAVAVSLAGSGAVSFGLETDQYYAWTQTLQDARAVINAKVNTEIRLALEQVNTDGPARDIECRAVERKIAKRFRFVIFQPIELWVVNAPLIDRYPRTPDEELEFRKASLYPYRSLLDVGMSIPPSPTIEVDGIRIGSDKLSHFFSNGWRYHTRYLAGLRRGLDPAVAEERAIERGRFFERTLLGYALSGVFSIGDMEANHSGMLFFRSLCRGESPRLERRDERWTLLRPFDIREHVSPEWDESYRPSVYSPGRWRRVRRVIATYCPLLADPRVVQRRREYARRDRETATDGLVDRLVREGRLDDPARYSIESVCDGSDAGARQR